MAGGSFQAGEKKVRPGLYVRFTEKAIASIAVGARSKVATILVQKKVVADEKSKTRNTEENINGIAKAKTVHRVRNLMEATELFGGANIEPIKQMIIGGATEVVVYVLPAEPTATDYQNALGALETYDFHVFVMAENAKEEMENAFAWMKTCKTIGKHFIFVAYDPEAEGNTVSIKAGATSYDDEYSVFVGNGVKNKDGNEVPVESYACYIAGLIAGTSLSGSLTYFQVPFTDVISRFRHVEIEELLVAGVLTTVVDGDRVKVEQGVTTATVGLNKIRTVRAKQAMIEDIAKTANDSYIGKITNNEDGQIALINAIKNYLLTLSNSNVIANDFTVELDKFQPSIGANVYLNIGVRFLDSIEYIYLNVTI